MKKLVLFFFAKKALLFALMFLPVFASAAGAPSFSPKFGTAVGGVIEQKAAKRGFAANDPRFNATIAAVGSVATTVALAAAGAAGAPLWLTIAVGAGVAAVVSLASDAIYDFYKWIFNEDGTVSTQGGAAAVDPGLQPGECYTWWGEEATICSGSAQSVCGMLKGSAGYMLVWGNAWGKGAGCVDPNPVCGSIENSNCGYGYPKVQRGTIIPVPGEGGLSHVSWNIAAAAIPADVASSPVNPQIVADAANKLWKDAASKPDYQGLPYSYSDPITKADVQQWQQANPGSYPSVGDAAGPAINPGTGTVPISTPGQVTNPTPGIPTAPGGSPNLDLGIDPVIGSPKLEPTPTGAQILAPITGLMPDLKNFQVPSHQAECPKPEFDIAVLHTHVRMDAHCTLFEGVRGLLYNGSLVAWIMAALFIVLSA
ncbi:hypothetical protein PUN49_01140 [Pseudomonas extremaustralis]|uniref:hypothetical protein n=1 Tax=Pseudomonas extremaustralis TaxID=359110 RepID=UPI00240F8FA4|nr:hypothetical protein [Pseudomonas extremaustralis]MDG2965634.1 hypothetical protein [Pseudomonas extremaustralis]MDG2965646.1 hypothetical protein [Pseudomonas extremaustralis]